MKSRTMILIRCNLICIINIYALENEKKKGEEERKNY